MLLSNYPLVLSIILQAMDKEFLYCENPDADVPRMFIDTGIGGKDADGNLEIQGNVFLKELLYLSDEMGKPNIEVWINSPGGIVTEGQSIYAAILASKANVDTICYGIAASIAGVDFQAGKKRKMFSNAHLMYHPAYSEDGRQDKGLEAANESVCIAISKRTGKTYDEIWAIMNRGKADDKGTWIGAEEALANGFCDEIIDVAKMNKNDYDGENIISVYKSANKILNRVKEEKITPKNMSKILNKAMGLNEEASEDARVEVFTTMNKSLGDMKKAVEDSKDELAKAKKELADYKETQNKADEEMKAKAKADEEMKAKADAEEMDKKADDEMKNAVTAGKIKNDVEVIKTFKAMYLANPKETAKVLEALPINKTAPTFNRVGEGTIKDSEAEAAVRAAGIKPGTGKWYNEVKSYELKYKK